MPCRMAGSPNAVVSDDEKTVATSRKEIDEQENKNSEKAGEARDEVEVLEKGKDERPKVPPVSFFELFRCISVQHPQVPRSFAAQILYQI